MYQSLVKVTDFFYCGKWNKIRCDLDLSGLCPETVMKKRNCVYMLQRFQTLKTDTSHQTCKVIHKIC